MARIENDEAHLERKIDEAIEETFPASDPPFWTLGLPRDEKGARRPGPRPPSDPTKR
ncbi:MAG: hypothetical protein AB1689_12000 [Thermodesulfobacteriota bacterium]